MYSVNETSDNPPAKALIFRRSGRRAGGAAGLHASSQNLPHPGSVKETSNTSHHGKRLNLFESTSVAS
jgi:hypothetical protein